MRQLTSVDAQFLALENRRQYGHVSGLAIVDPSTAPGGEIDLADMQYLLAERLPLLPPMRWRLAEVPLGLDYGYWVDDPEFDLDFHVRELGLAPPGDDRKLAEQVARLIARPLDRSRPLWELYLIHGLPDGRVAVLTKIHHAVVDGLSGAEILGILLDPSPEGRELPDVSTDDLDAAPGDLGMLARGLLGVPRYPLRVLQALPSTLPNLEDVAVYEAIPGAKTVGRVAGRVQRALGGGSDAPTVGRRKLRKPHTSFNGRLSAHRRFSFGQLSLDEVKVVKNEHGCTVNDVVVSMCASAVRRWLIEHDELPADPLVAQVPVSVRTPDQAGTFGNRIMLMSAPLFTNIEDPVERLRETHEALREMKDRHKALPAELLQDANHFIPPALFTRAAQATFSIARNPHLHPNWNLVVSNVPGPQFPLYLAGGRLEANYPVSVVTDGMGLNITVMSYCGHMDFGIVADRDQMSDAWCLIEWLEDALEELRPAAASDGTSSGGSNGAATSEEAAREAVKKKKATS